MTTTLLPTIQINYDEKDNAITIIMYPPLSHLNTHQAKKAGIALPTFRSTADLCHAFEGLINALIRSYNNEQ